MSSIRVAVWSYEFERLEQVEITDLDTQQDPVVVRHYSADHEGSVLVEDRYWQEAGVVWAHHTSKGADGQGTLVWESTSEWDAQQGAWVIREVECDEPR